MIKYRAKFKKIEAIEVLRETDKQVVRLIDENWRRENKVCDWYSWHDTWEDAHAFLIAQEEKTVNSLRLRLEQAKGTLSQIKGMKPSDK